MLRKIRVALALIFITGITLLFLDFTGTVHTWLGWMAKIQFLPALLALNVGVVAALVVLTLIFGRIYCSVICPLGVMQDGFAALGRRARKNRYRYSKALNALRYGMLALLVIAFLAGLGWVVALFAPYSAYGRIVQNLLGPVWAAANNLLASAAESADSYAFYRTEVWVRSWPVFTVAVVTLVVLAVLAWRNGRTYCNTICMDCIGKCHQGAISYTRRKASPHSKPADAKGAAPESASRRSFIITSAVAAGTAALKAQEKKVDGGLAVIEDKKIPARNTPVVPPGAKGLRHLAEHCTACQLCVAACPNGVLRPSTSLDRFMQPESSYERGYCRPECTKCSEVCPAGAIVKIDLPEKSSTQIGHAVWIKANCVVLTDDVDCGNCARHCPAGAIMMVASDPSNPDSRKIPVVNEERCIGCGACENLCPARPFSAIYVEGHEIHKTV